MHGVKSLLTLIGKRVEIKEKGFNEYGDATHRGVIKDLYSDSEATFIMLDNGNLVSTRYIASIKVLEEK
jgi:hypothetical protein